MTFDEVLKTLKSGTEDQIKNLEGEDVEYTYAERSKVFFVRFEDDGATLHGCVEEPGCVRVYGNRHEFAA